MSDTKADIETGIEYDTPAEVRAFVDSGEYAVTWEVNEVEPGVAEVEIARHEAGLADVVGTEQFSFDPSEKTVDEFAQEIAEADPEESINLAQEHFNN